MATEFVVALRDKAGREVKLDLNNGFVYDKAGNQVAKWSPKTATRKEHETQQFCADYVAAEQRVLMKAALESPRESMRELRDALKSAQSDAERTVLMDLGVGDVHLPAAMPNFAGGYRQALPMADVFAPPLLAPNPSDKYFIFDKNDAFQAAAPQVGSGGAAPAEVPPRLNTSTYSVSEYALGSFVPLQIDAAADAPLRIRQAALKRVMNTLRLRRELRVANLATNTANWGTNQTTTLGAGYQWDGGASSDPIKDIQTRIEQSLSDGVSGIIMPEPLFHAFQRNPNVQKYIQYKAGAKPLPNADEMGPLLELPPIYVAKMKYLAPAGGALTYVWGNDVILFRMPDQLPPTTQDDIATAYTFRWNAGAKAGIPDAASQSTMGFAASGGFVVREFHNQVRGSLGGSQLVAVHFDHEVMTSGFVGGQIHSAWQ